MATDVLLDLAGARRRRARVEPELLNRRVTTARLHAAWHVGRARYLISMCEQSVAGVAPRGVEQALRPASGGETPWSRPTPTTTS